MTPIDKTLEFLSTKGLVYNSLPVEIIRRAHSLFATPVWLLISGADKSMPLTLFGSEGVVDTFPTADEAVYALSRQIHKPIASIRVDLSELDERSLFNPHLFVFYRRTNARAGDLVLDLAKLIHDLVLRAVQRQRASARRLAIDAKTRSRDLSSFCHRMLGEIIAPGINCEGASIFVLDRLTGELRLRATTGVTGDQPLRDIVVAPTSESWINESFSKRLPLFEFDGGKPLHRGRTSESVAQVYSRIYWPAQLQFKVPDRGIRHLRNNVLGTLRIVNRAPPSSPKLPFTCLDTFCIEFYSELLFVLAENYIDSESDGFDKDVAFHTAATVAFGCVNNIGFARSLLFGLRADDPHNTTDEDLPARISLSRPTDLAASKLEIALNNALSFALDLQSQIQRANLSAQASASRAQSKALARTDRLLASVIQKAINLIPFMKQSHSLTCAHDVNAIFVQPYPPTVLGASGDLLSVFTNILENSVKYRKEGENIRLSITHSNDPQFVTVLVRDYGIGIEPGDEDKLFTQGFRSKRARRHAVRGSGLGLAYCKRVMEACGGTIKAVAQDDGLLLELRLKRA